MAAPADGEVCPALLGVRCDAPRCSEVFEADFLVRESDDRDTRLSYVLAHVETHLGWWVSRTRSGAASDADTFCPTHARRSSP